MLFFFRAKCTVNLISAQTIKKESNVPKLNVVKLGDKEQIGVKEPFPMTNCQFTS